jgi:uncharacterized repeat protein (TIGR01451 family)
MNNLSRALMLVIMGALPVVTSYAQASDVAITIEGSIDQQAPADRIAVGETVTYLVEWNGAAANPSNLSFEVEVPGVVTDITQGLGVSCTTNDRVRCTFGNVLADGHGYVWVYVRFDTPGVHTTTARVIRLDGTTDANPANDVATHTFEAVALPSVTIFPSLAMAPLKPGDPGLFSLILRNHGNVPATNVAVTTTLPAGGTILTATTRVGVATCTITNNAAVCTTPSLAQSDAVQIDFSLTAPQRMDGEDLIIEMVETQAEQDVDPSDNHITNHAVMIHQFAVTNLKDDGPGSLRQTIHDVNALCPLDKPCAILFRIPAPVPANGWFTIQPHTPLPEVAALVEIDGSAQTSFTGDSNVDGPEIELNGAFVHEQSGLRIRPTCGVDVHHLAVNGFPGYGIEVRRGPDLCENGFGTALIHENHLGTDPRGRIAKPNQRGLGVFTFNSYVTRNLISGNERAGVYIEDGNYYLIGGNRMGVGADGSPLGNGAGIFINVGQQFHGTEGADIVDNVIACNRGMAIARTRRGDILISGNSIFDNLQRGIDLDIDGMTPQRPDDIDVPNAPVLFSATYDPVQNATIVRGRIDSENFGTTRTIEVYASARRSVWAEPQAEQSVATATIATSHQDFEIVVPGDLRGKWITATHTIARYVGFVRSDPRSVSSQSHQNLLSADTSELSDARYVQ